MRAFVATSVRSMPPGSTGLFEATSGRFALRLESSHLVKCFAILIGICSSLANADNYAEDFTRLLGKATDLKSAGKYEEALENFARLRRIAKHRHGDTPHMDHVFILWSEAYCHRQVGNLSEALEKVGLARDMIHKLSEMATKEEPFDTEWTALVSVEEGYCNREAGNVSGSIRAFSTALSINIDLYGDTHLYTAGVKKLCADSYLTRRQAPDDLQRAKALATESREVLIRHREHEKDLLSCEQTLLKCLALEGTDTDVIIGKLRSIIDKASRHHYDDIREDGVVMLSQVCLWSSDFSQGIEMCENILEEESLSPDSRCHVILNLEECYRRSGKHIVAKKLLEKNRTHFEKRDKSSFLYKEFRRRFVDVNSGT